MGLSIGQAKQQFAVIIEGLHREPPLLSQFAVWLDLRLSEYKLQGGMRLDSHEVVSHPDWMQGIKCRCSLNTTISRQSLGFGNSAWLFPLGQQDVGDKGCTPELYDDNRSARQCPPHSTQQTDICQLARERKSPTPPLGGSKDGQMPANVVEENPPLTDDRDIFSSESPSLPHVDSKPTRNTHLSTASLFLSSLASSARKAKSVGMMLPTRPATETDSVDTNDMDYVADVGDDSAEFRSEEDSNDVGDEDDEIVDMIEAGDNLTPKIISVSTVDPESPICLPTGFRPSQKGKHKLKGRRIDGEPVRKLRVVRNYSREIKLKVISHALRHGTRSASLEFDVPKSNVQRWTKRVIECSPYCGLPENAGLESAIATAEDQLAMWVRDTNTLSGPISLEQFQETATSIFTSVHPDFEPAYVWILNFLAKYKLVSCVDIPTEVDDCLELSTGESSDLL